MRVLVVLVAAVACVVAKPAAVGFAYSAIAPWAGYPYAGATAYNPLAYSAYAPVASPVIPAVAPAVPLTYASAVSPLIADAGIKSQYHAQDELGQASYGHSEPGQSHSAVQDAAGNKVGSFSFINPEGKLIQTNYVADAAGYRVASNDLPVAPVHVPVGPAPVVDTVEVSAARAAHLAEVEAAKTRNKRDIAVTPAATAPLVAAPLVAAPAIAHSWPLARGFYNYPYSPLSYGAYPHAYPTTNTVPVVTGPHGYLADTPEVAAAKANHFAEVAAATARVAYPYVL